MEFTVRKATVEDCQTIRGLIQDLADYEKMPDGPLTTTDTLKTDGFGNSPYFGCHVAECNKTKKILGYTIYYFSLPWSGLGVHMEDLYVSPEFRNKGVGTQLWSAVNKEGLAIGAKGCGFVVLEWNTPSLDYYKRKGARSQTHGKDSGIHLWQCDEKTMTNLSLADGLKFPDLKITEGSETTIPFIMSSLKKIKDTDFLTITAEDITAGLKQPHLHCHILVAEKGDEVLGFSVFFFSYSTWRGKTLYLQTIYVEESSRRKGVGSALLRETFKFALKNGCRRNDMLVDANLQSAVKFFQHHGITNFYHQEDWLAMLLPMEAMQKFVEDSESKETSATGS